MGALEDFVLRHHCPLRNTAALKGAPVFSM
jgi:hypothetical protein